MHVQAQVVKLSKQACSRQPTSRKLIKQATQDTRMGVEGQKMYK